MAQQKFDSIVIGAGLTGLKLTSELLGRGQKVLLLDREDQIGSIHRSVEWNGRIIDNGLRLICGREFQEQGWDKLLAETSQGATFETVTNTPIWTFEAHQEKKQFLGFGSEPPEAVDQYNLFIEALRDRVDIPLHQIVSAFAAKIPADNIRLRSTVTSLILEGELVSGVVVNHSQKYLADNVYLATSPLALLDMVPVSALPLRLRQGISRVKAWSCLCLDFVLPPEPSQMDSTARDQTAYVLRTINADEPLTMVGLQTGDFWQWTLVFSEEDTEDAEALGSLVRKAKRLIKRAFPQYFEKKPLERVCVFENLALKKPLHLQKEPFQGLHLMWPLLSETENSASLASPNASIG